MALSGWPTFWGVVFFVVSKVRHCITTAVITATTYLFGTGVFYL